MGTINLYGYSFQYWSSEKYGVYAVYGTDNYSSHGLIYVGQSEDIPDRFKNHHKQLVLINTKT